MGGFGGFVLVRESGLDKAGREFERHGGKAILVGHLVPGIGAFISIPAGIKRMPILGRFVVYTVLGSALWNAFFVGLGWWLGSQWELVERYAKVIEYAVLVLIAGMVLRFLWRRWKAHREPKCSSEWGWRDNLSLEVRFDFRVGKNL